MTTHSVRRAPTKPGKTGYGASKSSAEATRKFNERSSYVQGFRTTMPAIGSVPVTVKLASPGRFLLGLAILPGSGVNADIGDCTVTLVVNGLNILVDVNVNNANPGFMQGRLYLPTPQPLQGDDSITVTLNKLSGAGVPVIFSDIFYLPR